MTKAVDAALSGTHAWEELCRQWGGKAVAILRVQPTTVTWFALDDNGRLRGRLMAQLWTTPEGVLEVVAFDFSQF